MSKDDSAANSRLRLENMESDGMGRRLISHSNGAFPSVDSGPAIIVAAVNNVDDRNGCPVTETQCANQTTIHDLGFAETKHSGSTIVDDEVRSTVKGELSDHCKGLLADGWIPTRWEHDRMGVIEMPTSGDVAQRYILPNGVIDEITRDGRFRIRNCRGLIVRGANGSLVLQREEPCNAKNSESDEERSGG